MSLPVLRHFQHGLIVSDPVQALVGEAWVQAVLCQREDGSQYWATLDMSKLSAVTEWRNGEEANQGGQKGSQGDGRVQAGNTSKRQARTGQGSKSKKQKASDCNSIE